MSGWVEATKGGKSTSLLRNSRCKGPNKRRSLVRMRDYEKAKVFEDQRANGSLAGDEPRRETEGSHVGPRGSLILSAMGSH